ncbi:MAG: PHP domain-containing protein [bacterium]
MLIDLHVHTNRYSSCAKASPEAMVAMGQDVGLDGMAITEHNVIWGDEEFSELQRKFPKIKLFRGIEVTTARGDDFLVYGITQPDLFYPRMPASKLISTVRKWGGAIVLAHPYRYHPDVPPEIFRSSIDALEIKSVNIEECLEPKIEALRKRLHIPGIAATDAHIPKMLGIYATCFSNHMENEMELVREIRSGAFSPCLSRRADRIPISGRGCWKIF